MAERLEIYRCEKCGNIVEVLQGGPGQLVCCGEPMELLDEQTADSSTEKHVPVVEKTDSGYSVRVGSVPHPMEEKHWIQWIELVCGGKAYRQFLKPGDEPEAEFAVEHCDSVTAREHCNVHGLWRG
jgi:superoxide reductase